jgi:hypothetical protein
MKMKKSGIVILLKLIMASKKFAMDFKDLERMTKVCNEFQKNGGFWTNL